MKKLHTLLLIAAVIAFGLIFTAIDNSSPPRAEKAVSQSETAQTVHADFVQSANFAQTGDIPIAVRRTDSANTRQVHLKFTDESPKENPKFIFATQIYDAPNVDYRGFGFDALSRSKI